MPYDIRKSGDKYKLILKKTGKILGTHSTILAAKKQISAIEISKKKK